MGVVHFDSQKARLDYLKGNFEEIVPKVAKEEEKVAVEKPKKAKKSAKKAKKEDENGEIQAE